jgi:hypothetical protein
MGQLRRVVVGKSITSMIALLNEIMNDGPV